MAVGSVSETEVAFAETESGRKEPCCALVLASAWTLVFPIFLFANFVVFGFRRTVVVTITTI